MDLKRSVWGRKCRLDSECNATQYITHTRRASTGWGRAVLGAERVLQ